MSADPTAAPIGTTWLAVVCETGEEDIYPTLNPVLKVGPNEWHGIEHEAPDYGWFRAEDYMVNHRATLTPDTLAPDLPEPTTWERHRGPVWLTVATRIQTAGYEQRVLVTDENGTWETSADDARNIAYALLAAVNYAEENS